MLLRACTMTSLRVLALVLVAALTGCTVYDSPPRPGLVGLEDGILPNPSAPVVLAFHESIVEETLSLRIVRFDTDIEGELLPLEQLDVIYSYNGATDEETGGSSVIYNERTFIDITLQQTLPIGPQLALIIDPGLSDDEGNVWEVEQVFKFGFEFDCGGQDGPAPTLLPTSKMFLLAEVEAPLQTQLQLLVDIRVDPETGDWVGQFTNADRDPTIDCASLGLSCAAEEVCRTLPQPACVSPSERAGTAEEWVDFFPNSTPPIGYSFSGIGCARDVSPTTFVFANAPADVEVQSPAITVKGLTFNLEVDIGEDGLYRGGGTFTAEEVFLGVTPSGSGAGTGTLVQIPDDQAPANIPEPPVPPGQPLP